MTAITYTRYELVRTIRNRRFFIFSLAFPLVLFLLVAVPNRHEKLGGIPFALYYMTGMVAWGTMGGVLASGARIAAERQVGWTRQMRVTPLPTWAYFRAKVLAGYLMAGASIAVLYAMGASFGVRLPVGSWLTMTGLVLVGLVPFAVLGILLGHLLTIDSMGPALGGITSLFALLGGAYGPLLGGGVLHQAAKLLPSYWLVQAGQSALGGGVWSAEGWAVIAGWTIVLLGIARTVYQRDGERV